MKRSIEERRTDWSQCFIFHITKKESLRSTPDRLDKLSDIIFHKLGGLKFDISRISYVVNDGVPNVKKTLIKNSAVYHHACASNYKERELHALKLRISKQQIQNNETQPSSYPMRSSSGISSLQIGNLQCCICGGEDSNSNLHAAGAFHATKTKIDSLHVL